MYSRLTMGILVGALLASGCASSHHDEWGYEGGNGPAHWDELSPAYATCAEGTAQSPIDLAPAVVGGAAPITFSYGTTRLDLRNNGHTVSMKCDAGSSIVIGELRYALKEIHFHAPAEHTVAGRSHPLCAHLVHRSANGRLAVVEIGFRSGEENLALRRLFAELPKGPGGWQRHYAPVDLEAFLPPRRGFYRYRGSLTTPPCTEGVLWTVMHEPVSLSPEQIGAFTSLYPLSRRPVQPLNGRIPLLAN